MPRQLVSLLCADKEVLVVQHQRALTPRWNVVKRLNVSFNLHCNPVNLAKLNWIMHGKLTQPTMLVWGYNDPTAELKRGHALFEIIADSNPKSEMHIINEAGHFCYREQPETFNAIVKAFVDKTARL